nr:MAG: protein of unknown function (DUF551) [Bacteriophage sp.]
MNKYKEALNTICDILGYYTVYRDESLLHRDDEIYDAMATLMELVDKADSFEWIPVTERLPEPPKENQELDYSQLDMYIVSIDEGYPVRAFWDGKEFGDGMFKLDVKAWMPLPKPYKENEDDC